MTASGQSESQFGQEYIKFLATKYLRNWYWFVVTLLLSLVGMFAYLTTLKYTYSAQASILIKEDDRAGGASKQDLMEELDMFGSKKQVENEIEIFKSYKLAEKVVDDLGLDMVYSYKDRWRIRDIYRDAPVVVKVLKPLEAAYDLPVNVTVAASAATLDGVICPYGKATQTPLGLVLITKRPNAPLKHKTIQVTMNHREAVIKSFSRGLRVSQPNKSASVLFLTMEDTAPDRAATYLDRLLYFYELSSLQDKNRVAANTLRFVEDRLGIISRELTSVEGDIQRYKTNSGIVDLSSESNLFLDKVKENDAQLSQVNIQLGTLREIENYLASKGDTRVVTPATVGLDSPTLTALVGNLLELESQREKLVRTVPEKSVPIETIDEQIRTTKRNIGDNVLTLRRILVSTQNSLQTTNKRIEATIRTIPQKERQLLDISRQASIKGNLYNYLLQKREETAMSFASTVSDLRVIDDAKAEPSPVKPVKRNYYLVALLVGLLLPVLVLWLLDYFNSKISRKSQIEDVTEAPIIGEVIQSDDTSSPLEITAKSRSLLSEQIRALRTNIQFFNPDGGTKQTILITSSISGEGKSFISLNLGASLAIAEKKVVMLELDMRKPKLHRYINETSPKGLSSYLSGQATMDEIIKPVPGYENLFFIPCGILPPNPSELISGDKMRYLFENLREHFDVVIADTPPVGLVTDANILAKHATMTLYIVRHLYTGKGFLKNIDTLYREKRFPNMCLVINGIDIKKDFEYNYGYGYDAGYGYMYRSTYGNEDDTSATAKKVTKKGPGFDFWNRK
ncbi:polysaccharide biosynthesis tyrosine autokinase [Fibrella sp. HMF5335]|uniref:non-specific protein-tyrosine kinase n=1 Tax=Fibrella rubiginis TaxID=2817060 RepID=A0A939JZE2_9BACT|nr:tyrosine-protein kinase [Fibrella rubiginis]MBO0934972.1 polysaccharide biosynthesis tyrosine autokinase [Fibrella rubiginis]